MQYIIKHVVQYAGNSVCLMLNRICEFVFTSIVKLDCPPKTTTSAPYDDILYYTLLLLKVSVK